MSETKLRPCPNPWCKGKSRPYLRNSPTFRGGLQAECDCGVIGPACSNAEIATIAWNTRPLEDELAEALRKSEIAFSALYPSTMIIGHNHEHETEIIAVANLLTEIRVAIAHAEGRR